MAYETIGAQDTISSSRDLLNGVTTRTANLAFWRKCDATAGTAPAAVEDGLVAIEEFAVSDWVYPIWRLPEEIDRATNATLVLDLVTRGAQASKKASFDIAILSIIPGTTAIGTATGTVQIVDVALPATDDTTYKATIAVPCATYFTGATVEALALRVKRVASSADPAAAVGLIGVSITHGIIR